MKYTDTELTEKEKRVFDYLVDSINENGYAPSVRDIAASLGIKSTSSVHLYLHNLESKGYIEQSAGKRRTVRIATPYAGGFGKVPILGAITAGQPILAVESFEGYVDLPWNSGKYPESELFALRIKGESMIDAGILDGDIVIVHKCTYADNGKIVAALVDDEATVKTFYKENGKYRLQPENPNMPPIIVDHLHILGVVVASLRTYD